MVQGVIGWRRRGMALLLLLACLPVAAATAARAAPDRADPARPLVLGILPFMSPIALLERFAPLRDHLSEQLGRPILLETARDYPEFIRRTGARHYDAVITAPHFVALALENDAYQVRATYADPLSAVVLVGRDSDVRRLSDLAGASVATPPEHAIVSWVGATLIDGATGREVSAQYRAYPSHNAAFRAVAAGEVSAAVVSVSLCSAQQLAANGLRELGRSADFPAMGILVASDLPPTLQERFSTGLVTLHDSAAGRAVLERIAYPGYRRATADDFEGLRPYVARVRRLMEPRS